MEKIQRKRMLWKIPLVVAILFAIFWGIWYLSAGQVPTTTEVKWSEHTAIKLPFPISRWWDVLFAPLWAVLLILLFTNDKIRKDRDLITTSLIVGLAVSLSVSLFGLTAGLTVGLILGLVVGLVCGLAVGLGFCLFVGLVASLVFGLVTGLVVGLVSSLGFGLVLGLGAGLFFGLAVGPVASLGVGLAAGLVVGLKFLFLFSKKLWKTVGHWLSGK